MFHNFYKIVNTEISYISYLLSFYKCVLFVPIYIILVLMFSMEISSFYYFKISVDKTYFE